MKTFLHLNNIYLNCYSFFFNYHSRIDGEIVFISGTVGYDSHWCGLFMEDPDPEWQVIDTLGSLCNYHSEEDGICLAVGGSWGINARARLRGIFQDDPNSTEFATDDIGSSAIILIMNISILNKFKE